MSRRGLPGSVGSGKDLYRLLQIDQESSLPEIKKAYKRLALHFHPDRHQGDESKTQKFRDITDAYDILSSADKRRQYDLQHGYRYNKNRRKPPPKNYRKVYAPAPPKHMKKTFDHIRHYEMHYGNGMMDEAVKEAMRTAEQEGVDLSYQSPIGKGFSFDPNAGTEFDHRNPFARKKHGRGTRGGIVFEYEEGTVFEGVNDSQTSRQTAQQSIHKRASIVEEMNGKRNVRKQQAEQRAKQQNSPFEAKEEACVIQ